MNYSGEKILGDCYCLLGFEWPLFCLHLFIGCDWQVPHQVLSIPLLLTSANDSSTRRSIKIIKDKKQHSSATISD